MKTNKKRFVDFAPIRGEGIRETEDGFLIADAAIARTGIQEYYAFEIGLADSIDDFFDIVRVYRPESEVRSIDSMKSLVHSPVTNDHPPEFVTPENWKDYAKGEVGNDIRWDDGRIVIPLILKDEQTIDKVKLGKREISAGYTCTIDSTPGVTDSGEEYDAVQSEIRFNHIAVVDEGRAGPECRIGDDASTWGIRPALSRGLFANLHFDNKTRTIDMPTSQVPSTRMVTVDGLSVETTDAGAQAIEKLQNEKAAIEAKLDDANQKLVDVETKQTEDTARLQAEIDSLNEAKLSDADIQKLVTDRANLVATASKIADGVDFSSMTDDEIRVATVKAKLGDSAVEGKEPAYIRARFDILAEDAGKEGVDPVSQAFAGGTQTKSTPTDSQATREAAYQKRLNDMQGAWNKPKN
jgi:hypothetical protein